MPGARVSPECGCAMLKVIGPAEEWLLIACQGRGRADPLLALDVAAGQHPQATRRHDALSAARVSGPAGRSLTRPGF